MIYKRKLLFYIIFRAYYFIYWYWNRWYPLLSDMTCMRTVRWF